MMQREFLLLCFANLGVTGVWQPQSKVVFDVCVVDTETQSYVQLVNHVKLPNKWSKPYTEVMGCIQTCHFVWITCEVMEWFWHGRWCRCGHGHEVVLLVIILII